MEKIKNCGRCGTESNDLQVFYSRPARERLCGSCHAKAKENRGLTAQGIAAENERWERIYREKFQDPNYYTTVRFRYTRSSFSELACQLETLCGAFSQSRRLTGNGETA